ncbi:hypothetical protein GPECTOR_49g527 [Gonium pectorale]|uniref:CBM20 domain-containing protein n=1 Tax=Gonium pectorale TaxID=33097 RepID=A0A150G832_GONPE|nr:hypothetical protein GPECTOR_49g527 [Gonium pectorale]|eukprot:KXZ45943.1 hypothetical protein GPECTOR_49g527 [Gonium pectorale]
MVAHAGAAPPATGAGAAGEVRVQVVVPKGPLPPGAQLVLVGGHPSLGAWEPARGAVLRPAGGTAYRVELSLPVDTAIAAKLVLMQDGLPIHWEGGNDRMIFLATPPAGTGAGHSGSGYLLVCEFEDTARNTALLWPPPASASAHEEELSALSGQLRGLEARSAQTEELYESMLKEMKAALDDALGREAMLHSELSGLQSRTEELQAQAAQAAAGVSESRAAEEAMRKETQRLRQVIQQYKEYLEEHDGELSRSLEREEALDAQLTGLQQVVAQQEAALRAAAERQEALAAELEAQRASAEAAQAKLEEQQKELAEAAAMQAGMRERAESMTAEISRLQELTEGYKTKLALTESEAADAAAREAEALRKVEAAGARETDLLGRVEKLQLSIAQYKSKLQDQAASLSSAAEREGALTASLAEASSETAALKQELSSLGGQYRKAVDTIASQQEQLEEAAKVVAKVDGMAVQVQTLQVELSSERSRHNEELTAVAAALEEAAAGDRSRMQAQFEMQRAVLKAEYEVKLTALKEPRPPPPSRFTLTEIVTARSRSPVRQHLAEHSARRAENHDHSSNGNGNGNGASANGNGHGEEAATAAPSPSSSPGRSSRWASMAEEMAKVRGGGGKGAAADAAAGSGSAEEGSGASQRGSSRGGTSPTPRQRTRVPANWRDAL